MYITLHQSLLFSAPTPSLLTSFLRLLSVLEISPRPAGTPCISFSLSVGTPVLSHKTFQRNKKEGKNRTGLRSLFFRHQIRGPVRFQNSLFIFFSPSFNLNPK